MLSDYRKKQILSRFEWEDVTSWVMWADKKWGDSYTIGKLKGYSLLAKSVVSLGMRFHCLIATCGDGAFAGFGHGTYWLTSVNKKRRLLFSEINIRELEEYGVHGC